MKLSHAQIAYQDAIELRKYALPSGSDLKFQALEDGDEGYIGILMKYLDLPDGQSEITKNELTRYYTEADNLFITEYLNPNGGLDSAREGDKFTPAEASFGNPINGLNITTIADGLAKFLVERTKQELTLAFFEGFREDLNDFQELRTLFPKTHGLLLAMGDEIYNFSAYINMLRETFEEDLRTIIPNLRTFIKSGLLTKYIAINPVIGQILENSLFIADQLQNEAHPGDVLTALANELSNDMGTNNIKNLNPSVQLLDLLSQSLRSIKDDTYWISSGELGNLLDDTVTLKIYLGLLYQQGEKITFQATDDSASTIPKTFREMLKEMAPAATEFETNKVAIGNFLEKLMVQAKRIEKSLETIKRLNKDGEQKSTYTEHYEFYISSLDFLQLSTKVGEIPILKKYVNFNRSKVDTYFAIAHRAGDLYLDVREQNYFSAVLNVQGLLENAIYGITSEDRNDLEKKLIESIGHLEDAIQENQAGVKQQLDSFLSDQARFLGVTSFTKLAEYRKTLEDDTLGTDQIAQLKALVKAIKSDTNGTIADLLKQYDEVLPKLFKYGNLAAGIAQAQDSDEVKKIIESVALPAGSASIKKKSKFNVALNAYVGLAAGSEYNGDVDETNFSFGVNAPVGISMSWGHRSILNYNKKKERTSSSIFLSLVDIGAVTRFRFADSKTEELPEIKLENVFAPGLYYVYGLPKWPISLGVGGQLGPQLREVTTTELNVDPNVSFTLQFFIAVDIPLLNFYTKSR